MTIHTGILQYSFSMFHAEDNKNNSQASTVAMVTTDFLFISR